MNTSASKQRHNVVILTVDFLVTDKAKLSDWIFLKSNCEDHVLVKMRTWAYYTATEFRHRCYATLLTSKHTEAWIARSNFQPISPCGWANDAGFELYLHVMRRFPFQSCERFFPRQSPAQRSRRRNESDEKGIFGDRYGTKAPTKEPLFSGDVFSGEISTEKYLPFYSRHFKASIWTTLSTMLFSHNTTN